MMYLDRGGGPGDALAQLNFHPAIRKSSEHLYRIGNYREAIKNALDTVEAAVRQKSGRSEHGTGLMKMVFSPTAPILRVSLKNSEQRGILELFVGAMSALRNRVLHKDTPEEVHHHDPYEALEELALASLLCHIVDKSQPI